MDHLIKNRRVMLYLSVLHESLPMVGRQDEDALLQDFAFPQIIEDILHCLIGKKDVRVIQRLEISQLLIVKFQLPGFDAS